MKKTIITFILLVLFTSCNKEVNNTQPENTLTSKQTEKIEQVNQVEKPKEIEKTNQQQELKETLEQKKELENRQEKLDGLLGEYEKLSNINKSKLECESLYITNENSTISEKTLAKSMISKCNKLKTQAQKEIDLGSKSFKITDCETSVKAKYKNMPKSPQDDKFNPEQMITSEIERCEIGYALRNGCENFTDTNKKTYCEELKELQKKYYLIESAKNFEVGEYLR